MGRETIEALTRAAKINLEPDVTLVLDISVADGLARAADRASAEDRYERMGKAFHERLRAGFLAIAASSAGRCVVIDATQPMDVVTEAIHTAVATRLTDAFAS